MKKNIVLILFFTAYLSACATTAQLKKTEDNNTSTKPSLSQEQKKAWGLMIGRTYINQIKKTGGRTEIITTRYKDGSYQVMFREHKANGTFSDSIELGEWGISSGIYFTIFKGWVQGDKIRRADPTDPYNRDAYKIITLDKDVFTYESLQDKTRYNSQRVAEDFVLGKPSNT